MDEETRYKCRYSEDVLAEAFGEKESVNELLEAAADYFDEFPAETCLCAEVTRKKTGEKIELYVIKSSARSLIAMTYDEIKSFEQHFKERMKELENESE